MKERKKERKKERNTIKIDEIIWASRVKGFKTT